MLNLGLIGFAQPWLLVALAALPALWLLLRLTPPAPRRVAFPGLFLLRMDSPEETPARTPLWLLLLRMLIAALLILALAGPLLTPSPRLAGSGPLLLVVDDGWAAAAQWERRLRTVEQLVAQAERDGREVAVLRTAPDENGLRVEVAAASAIREAAPGWQPRPWPVDRAGAIEAIDSSGLTEASVYWLADGLAGDEAALADAGRLSTRLQRLGPLQIYSEAQGETADLLKPPTLDGEALAVTVVRAEAGEARAATVRAIGPAGEVLAQVPAAFDAGNREATARVELPLELRNRIGRLELQPLLTAGGTVLFDERWRRRVVGLYGTHHAAASQPLLGDMYFIQRALTPFAELREGSVDELLASPLSMVVMADVGRVSDAERGALEAWMADGGVVLRFAGPRLAAGDDDFVPVRLRQGDRQLGGAMSWSEPLALAPFDPNGPFAGLAPGNEARVSRQVLAEPGPDLSRSVLASLSDGTPLITGKQVGKGWLILVHTTANTAWSSLPLSGLFVDMLRRVMALSPGTGGSTEGKLEPDALLDAFGRLAPAPPGLPAVDAKALPTLLPGPQHGPGLYAPAGLPEDEAAEAARSALNLQNAVSDLLPLDSNVLDRPVEGYREASEVDLAPWALLAALLLALADLVLSYLFRGLLPSLRPAAAAGAALLILTATPAAAQDSDERLAELTSETRLAYVLTGDPAIDDVSEAGLLGLGRVLAERTSIETGDPVGVNADSDELALFPLLYWPVPPDHPDLPPEALDKVRTYLRTGGMILFDTRDAAVLLPGQSGGGPGEARLGQILRGIDLPPLMPMPEDHVLTRSFYLLQDFPGRYAGQPVWVEQASNGVNDGVSGVIIGANDWAGAWAVDGNNRPLLPVDPGGEQQREMARRFGINVAMYAMTGNYKTDQVHIPALLERLGQ
ncbi:MAG: DUF4159 domain-containing protein [Geminicoccaceae bacterium]